MAHFHQVSARERGVIVLLFEGKSNKQIASALGVSISTVEFHLKNIYAKFQVSSRVELILKLGNTPGSTINEKLGYSAVDRLGEKAENRNRRELSTSLKNRLIAIGKELEMNNLQNVKHILIGVAVTLCTGFSWLALFTYYGNLTASDIRVWGIPLMIVLTMIGICVGLVGKRGHSALSKVFFSALFGTSLSFLSIIPLMLIVILPLGKFAGLIGLTDPFAPATMSAKVATLLGIIIMLTIWLVAGIAIGTTLLFVTIRKPGRTENHSQATENGW